MARLSNSGAVRFVFDRLKAKSFPRIHGFGTIILAGHGASITAKSLCGRGGKVLAEV